MSTYLRQPVFRDHPIAALVVICLSVFVISVDATIVNVALPTLSRELDADTAQLQWIVDAYTLVMAGLLLSAGSLSDRYGRRGWLSAGLAVFAVTSAVAAQVNTADGLIAARAAMGIGAAVIFPTTLALITNIFTDPVKRAKAIGLWAAMVGVGVAAGPDHRGLAARALLLGRDLHGQRAGRRRGHRRRHGCSSRPRATRRRRRVDVPGLILSSIGVTALVYTVIEAPNWGWGSARTVVGFAVAAVVLAAFALWERRTRIRCSTCRCSRTGGSPAAAWPSPRASSPCSASSSSSPSTSNSSSPTAHSRPVCGCCRSPSRSRSPASSGPASSNGSAPPSSSPAAWRCSRPGLAWASTVDAATPYTVIAMQMVLLGGGLGLTTAPATEAIMGSLSRRQGRRRLGRQRHHPRTRRHPRRCDRRQRLRVRVLGPARLRFGAGGTAR